MNESPIKACCPACKTHFNVTTGQLKVAAGMVRCGNCLHVFNATPLPPSDKPSPVVTAKPHQALSQDTAPSKPLKKTTSKPIQLNIPSIEIEQHEATTSTRSPFRYITNICIVALVAVLASQILWFKQEQWAQKDLFRPIYKKLYAIAELPLPAKKAPQLILNKKLIIQPHEELTDAIRVSILLENTANFSQPFPTLQLLFTDIKGRTTSQRTLAAEEYINTSLFPEQLMPSKQPIQLQIDLIAPGRRAVGYQLNMLFN